MLSWYLILKMIYVGRPCMQNKELKDILKSNACIVVKKRILPDCIMVFGKKGSILRRMQRRISSFQSVLYRYPNSWQPRRKGFSSLSTLHHSQDHYIYIGVVVGVDPFIVSKHDPAARVLAFDSLVAFLSSWSIISELQNGLRGQRREVVVFGKVDNKW